MDSIFKDINDFRAILPLIHRQFNFEDEIKEIAVQVADLYLVPYIGKSEYESLVVKYHLGSFDPGQEELLPYVQKAVAWYTYMTMHDTHAVHMSLQGLQESYSDDGGSRPASHWAKNDSKLSAANMADQHLDRLLVYLEEKTIEKPTWYQLWQTSQEYQDIFELMIWNVTQLSRYLAGGKSRKLLQDLRASMLWVQERDICSILGETLYTALIAAVKDRPNTALTAEQSALLKHIRPFLAKQTLKEAIPLHRVVVGNGGIFFQSYDGPLTKAQQTASDAAIRHLSMQLTEQAEGAKLSLQRWLDANKDDYPDYVAHAYDYPDGKPGYKHNLKRFKGSVLL